MKNTVNVYRGNLIECSHKAHIAVVDINKKIIAYHGNPQEIVYARSSVKPIQAIQVLESGACEKYDISNNEIAIMCASHSSEKYHVEVIESIFNKTNIKEDYLKCGTHIPFDINAYKEIISSGDDLNQKHHNCSGKHCGMLMSAKCKNEDINDYLNIDHPLQKRIIENLSILCDYNKEDIIIGLDGCGAPVHGLPLINLAYGFSQMSNPKKLSKKQKHIEKITESMMEYPEMVAGSNRFCTELMKVCKGRIFGKMGSQGVYLLGDKAYSIGIAVKVEDGSIEATNCAVVETLRQMNMISKEEENLLNKFLNPQVINSRGELVGEVKAEFNLVK